MKQLPVQKGINARGRRSDGQGFTIVELLIVVVVIAILAAIVIVAFNGVQKRAQTSAASSAVTAVFNRLDAQLELLGPAWYDALGTDYGRTTLQFLAHRASSASCCGGMGTERKPMRGPSTMARASTADPAPTSMAEPPARSMACSWLAIHPPAGVTRPSVAKTQCAIGAYTRRTQAIERITHDRNVTPLGDRTRQQGDRDDREGALKGGERQPRDVAHGVIAHDERVEEGELERAADHAADRMPEALAVADDGSGDQHGPDRDEAHHDHVEDAFGPNHAAVEEGEARGHEQHERGAHEHPGGMSGVDL